MNIEHLREFIELSRQLNFTSAAKTMHMTQPALSKHVRTLERETGVLLIERAANDRTRLTPAGQCFLDTALEIVSLSDDMLPRLRALQRNAEGKIVIRSPRHEYSAPLLNYIYEFQKIHSRIDVVICPWVDIDGIEDVISGKVDCAYLGYADYEDEGLQQAHRIELVPYTNTELLLWVDKSHPLAFIPNLGINDLNGRTLLIPANMKHDSWKACITGTIERNNLDCAINERYCDSLEDLALNKALPEDVLLCDASLLTFPPFQLREDRATLHFSPKVFGPVSICHKLDEDNPAMALFADFLSRKYLEERTRATA